MPRDRVVVKERVVERRHKGEVYVAGFGGYTLGHSFTNVDGTGALAGTGIESLDLTNSGVYGMKVGYFHPERRLNWLGFELEGFNTTPHLEQQNGFIGSNLRVAAVAINVIARKRLACDDRDRHDRTRRVTTHDKDGHDGPMRRMVGITTTIRMAAIMMMIGRRKPRMRGVHYKSMLERVRRYSLPRLPINSARVLKMVKSV